MKKNSCVNAHELLSSEIIVKLYCPTEDRINSDRMTFVKFLKDENIREDEVEIQSTEDLGLILCRDEKSGLNRWEFVTVVKFKLNAPIKIDESPTLGYYKKIHRGGSIDVVAGAV